MMCMYKRRIITIIALILSYCGSIASAVVYWDNDTGNKRWQDALNWSGNAGPTANPAIDIGTPNGVNECIIGSGVIANEPASLSIGYNTATEGALLVDGGSLVCNEFLNIGYKGKGTCRLKSGSISTVLDDVKLGGSDNGDGMLNIEGGTITVKRFFCPPLQATAKGTVNMSGGLIVVTDYDFGKGTGSTLIPGEFTVNISAGTIHPTRDFYAGKDAKFTMDMTGGLILVGGASVLPMQILQMHW